MPIRVWLWDEKRYTCWDFWSFEQGHLFDEPFRQLFHHGAGCPQSISADDDLPDHEVVQKLSDILEDMLGAKNIAELTMLLPLGIEVLVETRSLELPERTCRIAIEAVSEQPYDISVSGIGLWRQAALLSTKIFRKHF